MARLHFVLAIAMAAMVPTALAQGGIFTQRLPIQTDPNTYRLAFDGPASNSPTFPGGSSILRNPTTGLTPFVTPQAIITIRPNAVLAPHFHPRGTEQLFVVSGSAEVVQFLEDNNLRRHALTRFQAVILPAGGVHYTRNSGTEDLVLIQTFDNPLPGTIFISNALVALDRNIVNGALIGANLGPSVTNSTNIFQLSA